MPKTKPRIDKKSAITFKLVPRSQHDPLIADETAPQHVLQEVGKETDDRREEQIKYGIYFDDDYDYLKHLKTTEEFERGWEMVEEKQKGNKSKLNLPSSVFPSIIEEDEGLLNKAAPVSGPQLDMDPDIVQAMDDDFDLDNPANQLTDDYLTEILEGGVQEGGDGPYDDEDEEDEREFAPSYSMARFAKERFIYDDGHQESGLERPEEDSDTYEDEEQDQLHHLQTGLRRKFSKEETKSVFTEYSLTSSVQHRNEGLTMVDERFENFVEREYADDMAMGACDFDDIEGPLDPNNSPAIRRLIEEEKEMKEVGSITTDDKLKTMILNGLEGEETESDDERGLEQLEIELDAGKHRERLYDCESILSTYSTLYNHPKLIRTSTRPSKKITIDPSTGIVIPQNTGLTKKNLRELDSTNDPGNSCDLRSNYSRASRISELTERTSNETPEERKARKLAFKELKRERRLEKKANKMAFKLESNNHQKELVRLKNGVNNMKLI